MTDCKFAAHCGGGHTTAQHFLNVYERRIKESCGIEAFHAIEEAVNREASGSLTADPFVQGGTNHTTTTNASTLDDILGSNGSGVFFDRF